MGSHHVPRPGCGSAASGDSCPGVPHPLIPMFPQCPWLFCPASCFPGAARAPPHPILLPAGGGCRPCTTGLGPASEDFLNFWAVVGLVPPSPPISRPPPGADLEGGGWTWRGLAAITPSAQRLPPAGNYGYCHLWWRGEGRPYWANPVN